MQEALLWWYRRPSSKNWYLYGQICPDNWTLMTRSVKSLVRQELFNYYLVSRNISAAIKSVPSWQKYIQSMTTNIKVTFWSLTYLPIPRNCVSCAGKQLNIHALCHYRHESNEVNLRYCTVDGELCFHTGKSSCQGASFYPSRRFSMWASIWQWASLLFCGVPSPPLYIPHSKCLPSYPLLTLHATSSCLHIWAFSIGIALVLYDIMHCRYGLSAWINYDCIIRVWQVYAQVYAKQEGREQARSAACEYWVLKIGWKSCADIMRATWLSLNYQVLWLLDSVGALKKFLISLALFTAKFEHLLYSTKWANINKGALNNNARKFACEDLRWCWKVYWVAWNKLQF